jgi:hypothetical protein
MTAKVLKSLLLATAAVLLVSCATPVMNVDSSPINISSPSYDLEDVTKAIQTAGVSRGWRMKEQTPGHIIGTLHVRSHMAQVDIIYSLDEYSITYKSSTNLDYDGTNIHRNYNSWVRNLDNDIQARLSTL